MQRLPQSAWRIPEPATPRHGTPGHYVLQVPQRQSGTVRLRARARENRGLCLLPYAARQFQSAPAEARAGELALFGVPRIFRGRGRARDSYLPQSGPKVSGLHHVPYLDSRFEYGPVLLQAIRRPPWERVRTREVSKGDSQNGRNASLWLL